MTTPTEQPGEIVLRQLERMGYELSESERPLLRLAVADECIKWLNSLKEPAA